MTPIRVMVVDDSASVREGLSISLEAYSDLELVAEASTGAEAIRLCAQVQPDIILMDLAMPGVDGVEATRAIRSAHPDVHIVVLTGLRERFMIQEALQAGAIRYLLKNVSVSALVDTIRAVANEFGLAGQPSPHLSSNGP